MTRHFRIKKIFNGTTEHFIVQQRWWGFIWWTANSYFPSICKKGNAYSGSGYDEYVKFNTLDLALEAIEKAREIMKQRASSFKCVVQVLTITV